MQQALNLILESGFASAAHATLLALIVLVVTRVWRNAQVAHLLWLLVLVKLIVPTCWTVTIPVPSPEFLLIRPDDPATVSSSLKDQVEDDSFFSVPLSETMRQVGLDEALIGEDVKWEGLAQVESISSPGITAAPNAVNDLEAEKAAAQSRSRSRETSGLHQERPNSHVSGYRNRSRCCLEGIATLVR